MVRYLTMNGTYTTQDLFDPFALRYRRVNGTFYERIKFEKHEKRIDHTPVRPPRRTH